MEKSSSSKGAFKRKRGREPGIDARKWPRFTPEQVPSLKGITSNQGAELQVINISRGGALLETRMRLAPGTRIMLKVVTVEGVIQIAGQVLRSSISSLEGAPKYQSAVAFESPLHILDDLTEQTISLPKQSDAGSASLQPDESLTGSRNHEDSRMNGPILSVSAWEAQDTALYEMLKLNDW